MTSPVSGQPTTMLRTTSPATSVASATAGSVKARMISDIQAQISMLISLLIKYNLESRRDQFKDTMNEVKQLIQAANTHLDAAKIKLAAGCVAGSLQMAMGVAALHSASKMASTVKADNSRITFKKDDASVPGQSATANTNNNANVNGNAKANVTGNTKSVTNCNAKPNGKDTKQGLDDAKQFAKDDNVNIKDSNKPDGIQNSDQNKPLENNPSNKEESLSEQNNRVLEMKYQAGQTILKAINEFISSGLDYHSAQIECDSEKQRAEAKKASALANVDESTLRTISDATGALYQILQQLNNMEVAMNQTLTR